MIKRLESKEEGMTTFQNLNEQVNQIHDFPNLTEDSPIISRKLLKYQTDLHTLNTYLSNVEPEESNVSLLDESMKKTNIHKKVVKRINSFKEMHKPNHLTIEKEYDFLLDTLSEGVIIWEDSCLIKMNDKAKDILEVKQQDFNSVEHLVTLFPNHQDYFNKQNMHETFVENVTLRQVNKPTKIIEARTKKYPKINRYITTLQDITEHNEMQKQLRQTDTLNMVGELAAGIAHEIRNPLTSIKGFIKLMEPEIEGKFLPYFNVIVSELNRTENILTDLLVLSKPKSVHYEICDINIIVKETVDLLSAEAMFKCISLVFEQRDGAVMIECECNQLKQALINIIKNGIEAMESGGNITVTIEPFQEDHINIKVKDEGPGLSTESLKKMKQPFYTTKDTGTGLGLPVTFNIIEEHNGWIDIQSTLNKGTTFSLYLPKKRT